MTTTDAERRALGEERTAVASSESAAQLQPDADEVIERVEPIAWMSTRSLEQLSSFEQVGASTYQVANGKFDRWINPLVLLSDHERALQSQRQKTAEAQAAGERFAIQAGHELATANRRIEVLTEALRPFVEKQLRGTEHFYAVRNARVALTTIEADHG